MKGFVRFVTLLSTAFDASVERLDAQAVYLTKKPPFPAAPAWPVITTCDNGPEGRISMSGG
jgi:hypothetical protein